jgi:hemerythrin
MLQWNEKFETGHMLIDTQHRVLISYVNRVEDLSQATNPSRDQVELFFRFMEFLETYILTHFQAEEDCMYRFRCPAHFENKKAHTEFLDYFRQFNRQLAIEGYHPDAAKELHNACAVWIQRHILRVDTQLKGCQKRPPEPE